MCIRWESAPAALLARSRSIAALFVQPSFPDCTSIVQTERSLPNRAECSSLAESAPRPVNVEAGVHVHLGPRATSHGRFQTGEVRSSVQRRPPRSLTSTSRVPRLGGRTRAGTRCARRQRDTRGGQKAAIRVVLLKPLRECSVLRLEADRRRGRGSVWVRAIEAAVRTRAVWWVAGLGLSKSAVAAGVWWRIRL